MLGRKRVIVSAAAGITALLVVASVALAENYQYRFTSADQALAARIVLERSDVPPLQDKGWNGGAVKPDLSPDLVQCPGYYAPKESDLVITGDKETDFSYKGGQELDTYATVFQSSRMVETDWQRSDKMPSFFKCMRAKWTTIAGRGSKIISMTQLSLPRFGPHSVVYRVVFEYPSSRRVAIDSVNLARGRFEVEVDQIVPAPTSSDLRNMKIADRGLASLVNGKLLAAVRAA